MHGQPHIRFEVCVCRYQTNDRMVAVDT